VPLPPTDAEKYVYDKRRLPVLMIASLVSFSCLLASQTLLLRSTPAMLLLAPAVGFTMIYYLVSVTVNIFTRGFSFQEHDRVVRAWRPERFPRHEMRNEPRPRDVFLRQTGVERGWYAASECVDPEPCVARAPRLWLIYTGSSRDPLTGMAADRASLLKRDYKVTGTDTFTGVGLVLLTRAASQPGTDPGRVSSDDETAR